MMAPQQGINIVDMTTKMICWIFKAYMVITMTLGLAAKLIAKHCVDALDGNVGSYSWLPNSNARLLERLRNNDVRTM